MIWGDDIGRSDGILSCEFLGYYKPSLQAYPKGTSLLGLKPAQAMMVAAHKGDLAAARTTGMHTAYVNVPEEDNTADFGPLEAHGVDVAVLLDRCGLKAPTRSPTWVWCYSTANLIGSTTRVEQWRAH